MKLGSWCDHDNIMSLETKRSSGKHANKSQAGLAMPLVIFCVLLRSTALFLQTLVR